MVVERHRRETRTRKKHQRNQHRCHYQGHIRGDHNSNVALSACDGIVSLYNFDLVFSHAFSSSCIRWISHEMAQTNSFFTERSCSYPWKHLTISSKHLRSLPLRGHYLLDRYILRVPIYVFLSINRLLSSNRSRVREWYLHETESDLFYFDNSVPLKWDLKFGATNHSGLFRNKSLARRLRNAFDPFIH